MEMPEMDQRVARAASPPDPTTGSPYAEVNYRPNAKLAERQYASQGKAGKPT
jgi:hypothetical protein